MEISTPLGRMIALANDSGITHLYFSDNEPDIVPTHRPSHISALHLELCAEEIRLYFAGKLRKFTTPRSSSATVFQTNVYFALQNIPYGNVSSYGEIAAMLGAPRSARAVGAANACNPTAIIIPCHRIISRSGKLTGYAWGLWRKSYLLEMEKKFSSV